MTDKSEHLMTQTEARRKAHALRAQGIFAVAHKVPPTAWGGQERGWTVTGMTPQAEADLEEEDE